MKLSRLPLVAMSLFACEESSAPKDQPDRSGTMQAGDRDAATEDDSLQVDAAGASPAVGDSGAQGNGSSPDSDAPSADDDSFEPAPEGTAVDAGVQGSSPRNPDASSPAPLPALNSDAGSSEIDAADASTSVGDVADDVPVISDVTIEPNPNNRLSCIVSWITDRPATSEVQFGIGDVEFRVGDDELVTEHRVLVIGMRADTDYVIRAVSKTASGEDSFVDGFRTGMLPTEVPVAEVITLDSDSMQPGWTLTNIMAIDETGFGSLAPALVVIYDEDGIPIWYYTNGQSLDDRGDISVDYLGNGRLLIGPAPGEPPREIDVGGEVVWEGPSPDPEDAPMTHHAGLLENGNIVVVREPQGDIIGARVDEYTRDNERVWSWNLLDQVTPPGGATGDWCHANSTTIDLDADVVYLNCRMLGLIKAERSGNQDVIWLLGGSLQSDVVGDFLYPVPGSQFTDAHDPEIHEDGTIMLYDNGGYGLPDLHSRIVEYQIDEDAMEANLVWEFPGSFDVDPWYRDEWYTPLWGDADRLPNRNVLVSAGLRGADAQTRIFEVTDAGQVVWAIVMPPAHGSYRAERIPALVDRLATP